MNLELKYFLYGKKVLLTPKIIPCFGNLQLQIRKGSEEFPGWLTLLERTMRVPLTQILTYNGLRNTSYTILSLKIIKHLVLFHL